jgi:chemotaxis protein methyltransferase CheR
MTQIASLRQRTGVTPGRRLEPHPAGSLETGYPLGLAEFNRLAAFIERACGIKMPPSKLGMLKGRLRRRLIATGCAGFAEYCHKLFEQGHIRDEAVHLIDAVTTTKTDFFREPEHFRFLTDVTLPDFIEQAKDRRQPFKVWSSACSIGAEPYTLAMILAELGRATILVQGAMIIATDISTEALKVAAQGIYPESMLDPVPPALRRRYVMTSKDRATKEVRIVPELRAMVRYLHLNLMDQHYTIDRDLNAIFCRNGLIYFDRETQRAVVRRLCDHLAPGGHLFVGHSETLNGFDLPLRQVGPTTFRRLEIA